MPSSTEGRIWATLQGRLRVVLEETGLPIAWQNKSFAKPASGKYLRASFIPNTADRIFIGSQDPHRFLGILQIDVKWPGDTFLDAPLEIAGQVAGYFPADLRLISDGVTVRIRKHADVGPLIVEEAGVMVPLTIEYESFS